MSLQASACRKNGFLMIKGHACKIVEMSTSKTGKHGHAKVKFTAVDIFDNSKHEMIESSTHNVDIPNVKRTEWQLLDIDDDGFLSLMDVNSADQKDDIKIKGDEVGDLIRDCWTKSQEGDDPQDVMVTILNAIGKEQAIDGKLTRS
mmetsp:Transcript_18572/g.55062  ORF Transcript_18572/g.55062 Transcript_18572/m.55062 type:complete len:146 (-) Transcript_18572:80-517(-)